MACPFLHQTLAAYAPGSTPLRLGGRGDEEIMELPVGTACDVHGEDPFFKNLTPPQYMAHAFLHKLANLLASALHAGC